MHQLAMLLVLESKIRKSMDRTPNSANSAMTGQDKLSSLYYKLPAGAIWREVDNLDIRPRVAGQHIGSRGVESCAISTTNDNCLASNSIGRPHIRTAPRLQTAHL